MLLRSVCKTKAMENLSILQTAQEGVRRAPFYDMMSATLYAGISKKFVFNIGEESNLGSMQAEHLQAMTGRPTGFQAEIHAEHCRETGQAMDRLGARTAHLTPVK